MICNHPLNIKKPGQLTGFMSVPCGHCPACLENKRKDWVTRLLHEAEASEYTYFITLTYEENITSVDKSDCQRFFKRLRKKGFNFRYYLVAEYGTKNKRPHYHYLYFSNMPISVNDIEIGWSKGFVYVGTVTIKSIMYVTKYHVLLGDYPYGCEKPFTLMSRKPGIGFNYIEVMGKYHSTRDNLNFVPYFQYKRHMPRYYSEKIYTKEKRKELSARQMRSLSESNSKKELERHLGEMTIQEYRKYIDDLYKNKERQFKHKFNQNNKL